MRTSIIPLASLLLLVACSSGSGGDEDTINGGTGNCVESLPACQESSPSCAGTYVRECSSDGQSFSHNLCLMPGYPVQ